MNEKPNTPWLFQGRAQTELTHAPHTTEEFSTWRFGEILGGGCSIQLATKCLLGASDHDCGGISLVVAQSALCGGGHASTSDRITLEVCDDKDSALPTRLVLKTILLSTFLRFGDASCEALSVFSLWLVQTRFVPRFLAVFLRSALFYVIAIFQRFFPHAPDALYENEVRVYTNILQPLRISQQPLQSLVFPRTFGAFFSQQTREFAVLMEDLSCLPKIRFPRPGVDDLSLAEIRLALAGLAELHAEFIGVSDLPSWLPTRLRGGMFTVFSGIGRELIRSEIQRQHFKRDLLSRLGKFSDVDNMWPLLWSSQATLDRRPWRSVLHGDAHCGNLYVFDDGGKPMVGFLDWQLSAQGSVAIDPSYLIATALNPKDRRVHERKLFEFYRTELVRQCKRRGRPTGELPSLEQLLEDHALAVIFGLIIGWLICPEVNYGREITENYIERMAQACVDLQSFAKAQEVHHTLA